jgi:hypothetical protein
VLPDINQHLGEGNYAQYNVVVDMHSKSYSAHVPIKTNVEIQFLNSSIPASFARYNSMYVIFDGSHNEPPKYAGLGYVMHMV